MVDLPDKSRNDAICSLFLHFHKRWFGRRLCITCWCAWFPWPSATPPTGWLKCNGAAFDKVKYPHLATAYPSGKLPDLRGEFIRGWDDGRGIDAGRALLSIQTGMLEKHRHIVVANDGYDSKEEWELATIFRRAYTQGRGLDAADAGGTLIPSPTLHTRGSIGNTGGSETRPRNIAFNYIVRAA